MRTHYDYDFVEDYNLENELIFSNLGYESDMIVDPFEVNRYNQSGWEMSGFDYVIHDFENNYSDELVEEDEWVDEIEGEQWEDGESDTTDNENDRKDD